MSAARIPVREAFPPGAWEQACLEAARRCIAGWRAELVDGTELCVDARADTRATVCIHGRGPAALWLALDDPGAWWPTAPGWESSDWRDTLLLQALQPVLAGLAHWMPGSEPWQCDWCASPATAPTPDAASLGLNWFAGGEVRRLSLHWCSTTEALHQWALHGAAFSGEEGDDEVHEPDSDSDREHDVDRDGWTQGDAEAPGPGRGADEPATEARVCVAALQLSALELSTVQPGGGIVLGELSPSARPVWLRAGAQWLVAEDPAETASTHDTGAASQEPAGPAQARPDATLPVVPEDGALWVLSAPSPVSASALATSRLERPAIEGQDCTLWLQGHEAGRGRLIEHDGLTVLQVTEWPA